MGPKETYSTSETAKILRISARRVTQLPERGELEGAKDGAGRWRVSQRARPIGYREVDTVRVGHSRTSSGV